MTLYKPRFSEFPFGNYHELFFSLLSIYAIWKVKTNWRVLLKRTQILFVDLKAKYGLNGITKSHSSISDFGNWKGYKLALKTQLSLSHLLCRSTIGQFNLTQNKHPP